MLNTSTHQTKLTSRERVNRAMDGRDHDRIPRHESFWTDTINRWTQEGHLTGGQDEALQKLQSDMQGICWQWPSPFGDQQVLEEDEQTQIVRDHHGKTVRLWKHRMGTPEHIDFGCKTRDDWETVYKPRLLKEGIRTKPDDTVELDAKAKAGDRWSFLAGIEGFEATRTLIGDEIAMIAMMEDPQWIMDISDTVIDLSIQGYEQMLAAGAKPDGLWVYGDMAYNHATMCSPEMYKELLWPGHKRLADWAHSHGMKFIYHTDGDVNGVIDLYVEAGFDCLQPLEAKANMDIRKLCPMYGDALTFFGNIDVMILGSNDLEKVEAEVTEKLAAGMATKRYIYHSDHSIPPSCNFETWQFVIALVERLGWYD